MLDSRVHQKHSGREHDENKAGKEENCSTTVPKLLTRARPFNALKFAFLDRWDKY